MLATGMAEWSWRQGEPVIDITDVPMHDGATASVTLDRFPDRCPVCHRGIEPIRRKSSHCDTISGRLELVFRCPRERCQSLFIARYSRNHRSGAYFFSGSFPYEPRDAEFSDHIKTISPHYCATANEAQKAENEGWKLIAGPGYRKALEFLIKDYLCLSRPKYIEQITKVQLGPCISAFVENEKVKATAARAVWLGNDETHYTRKWDDKDLEDLKKLIQLTVHWIEMEEMTASVVKEMPEGKI
jgi:hypothetical protein